MTAQTTCRICSQLKDIETGFSKYCSPDTEIPLPEAYKELIVDVYVRSGDQTLKCPLCGTRYHYQEDYTYLAPGSEDEITLTRLTGA